jgi:hypothetical protein
MKDHPQTDDEQERFNETFVGTAISAATGAIPVAHEWPPLKGPRVLALDVVGNHAGVWVVIANGAEGSAEAVVGLVRDDDGWSWQSINRQDGLSAQEQEESESPVRVWSHQISFRHQQPMRLGAAMVWGRAVSATYQVGFGFADPQTKFVEEGTGCFLLLREVDQNQASLLRNIEDQRERAVDPILRVWKLDGSVMDIGRFSLRRSEGLSVPSWAAVFSTADHIIPNLPWVGDRRCSSPPGWGHPETRWMFADAHRLPDGTSGRLEKPVHILAIDEAKASRDITLPLIAP